MISTIWKGLFTFRNSVFSIFSLMLVPFVIMIYKNVNVVYWMSTVGVYSFGSFSTTTMLDFLHLHLLCMQDHCSTAIKHIWKLKERYPKPQQTTTGITCYPVISLCLLPPCGKRMNNRCSERNWWMLSHSLKFVTSVCPWETSQICWLREARLVFIV